MNLARAIDVAMRAHAGQLYGGEPYVLHPLRVAAALHRKGYREELVVAGVLHDVLEDAPTFEGELVTWCDSELLALLRRLRRDPAELYFDSYLARVRACQDARAVKLEDIADHLAHPDTLRPEQRSKYVRARAILTQARIDEGLSRAEHDARKCLQPYADQSDLGPFTQQWDEHHAALRCRNTAPRAMVLGDILVDPLDDIDAVLRRNVDTVASGWWPREVVAQRTARAEELLEAFRRLRGRDELQRG